MKKLAYVFWSLVAGIAICLVMSIYTGIAQHRVQAKIQASNPTGLPTPAQLPR